ncbi:hypothetical protein HGRIS_011529 [Hohenbuehelia grisea]|uniref:F-box domain-containing protein n=1 Tax=Hohenbuehelia grisea TaxID=104357 RepID=A0ABR3JWF7_9AGAR
MAILLERPSSRRGKFHYTHVLQSFTKPIDSQCAIAHRDRPQTPFCQATAVVGMPQEIVDYIIDLLAHDIATLKSAAVVCQSWLPRCQMHLLRRISLPHHDSSISLNKQLSSLHVAKLVQEVTISLSGNWIHDHNYYRGLKMPEIPREFSNLTRLRLVVRMPMSPTPIFCLHSASLGLPRNPAVRRLAKTFPLFEEVEILLVLQAPSESTITMSIPAHTLDQYSESVNRRGNQRIPGESPVAPLPQVKGMELLHSGMLREMKFWLLSSEPSVNYSTIHTCAVSLRGWHAVESMLALKELIAIVKNSLVNLSLDFEGVNGREEQFQDISSKFCSIDFNALPRLKTLTLAGITPFLTIPHELREASKMWNASQPLEELNISISPLCMPSYYTQDPGRMKYRPGHWRGIDEIFTCEEKYPRMKRIHIDVSYDGYARATKTEAEVAHGMLKARFPGSTKRGIFSCSVRQKQYLESCKCRNARSLAGLHVL